MLRTHARLTTVIAAAAIGLSALTGCTSNGAAPGPANSENGAPAGKVKLRVSIPPVADSLPVFVALENGYFDAEGLSIELVPAANGATAVNSLVSQSTEIALISYPTLINAYSAGIPVTIGAFGIEGTDEYQAAAYVKKDSPLKTLADMVGKTMATPSLNSVGDIFLSGEFIKEGLDPKQVTFVEIPQANMAVALEAGDVDAAFITEPTLSAASKQVDIRPLAVQHGPQGLFATSQSFLDKNQDAIGGFRAALVKAVGDIDKDPHGVAEKVMPKYSNMDAETAKSMHLPLFQTKWNHDGIQDVIDVMVKLGIIKEGFDANVLYKDF